MCGEALEEAETAEKKGVILRYLRTRATYHYRVSSTDGLVFAYVGESVDVESYGYFLPAEECGNGVSQGKRSYPHGEGGGGRVCDEYQTLVSLDLRLLMTTYSLHDVDDVYCHAKNKLYMHLRSIHHEQVL